MTIKKHKLTFLNDPWPRTYNIGKNICTLGFLSFEWPELPEESQANPPCWSAAGWWWWLSEVDIPDERRWLEGISETDEVVNDDDADNICISSANQLGNVWWKCWRCCWYWMCMIQRHGTQAILHLFIVFVRIRHPQLLVVGSFCFLLPSPSFLDASVPRFP